MNHPMIMPTAKQNWFPTLNASLESEDLVDHWLMGLNISYGETVTHIYKKTFVSIYRSDTGMYERPIHYKTLM